MRSGLRAAAFIVCLGGAASAQTHPDFSGAWVAAPAVRQQPAAPGQFVVARVYGDSFVVHQDERTLTLDITAGTLKVHAVYQLDGSESRNKSPEGPGGTDVEIVSHALWDGDKLVILTSSDDVKDGQKTTLTTKRVLWIDASGTLIVERTGVPPGAVTPSRSYYRRAS